MDQQQLFDAPSPGRVRRADPRTSKKAAASNPTGRRTQRALLLDALVDGPISADTGARIIGRHRSIASARLGQMVDDGVLEHAGEHLEPDDDGHERLVLRYRLTPAGLRQLDTRKAS